MIDKNLRAEEGHSNKKNLVGVCSPLFKPLLYLWQTCVIFLPYLWPDQKFDTLFMIRSKIWFPSYDLTKNLITYLWPDQKFDTLFMTWPKIQYPIYDLTENLIPYLWPNRNSIPCLRPALYVFPYQSDDKDIGKGFCSWSYREWWKVASS